MAQFNPLEIIMCGDKRQYYAYDGELYTATFPQEWVKSHSCDGTGPGECKNCNIFGSWNGVFIGYCMNCAEYVYNFERGKGFCIMGIETLNNGKGISAFNSYLKNCDLKDIGDVDFMNSMDVIDSHLEHHVELYFESSEYRETHCSDKNGKQTIMMDINYQLEFLQKIFHFAEEYVITFDKLFNKITFYQDTMECIEDQIDAISNRGLELIDEKNTAELKQEQEQTEEEMKMLYEIYCSEKMDEYMRGIDIGGYSMVVPTTLLTFEEFKIKTYEEYDREAEEFYKKQIECCDDEEPEQLDEEREMEVQYSLYCKEEYEKSKNEEESQSNNCERDIQYNLLYNNDEFKNFIKEQEYKYQNGIEQTDEEREKEIQYDIYCMEECEKFKKEQDYEEEMKFLYQIYCDGLCENYKEDRRSNGGEIIDCGYSVKSYEEFKMDEQISEYYKNSQEENDCPDEFPLNENTSCYGSYFDGGYDSY